jgi:putative thioredoxin
MQQSVANRPLDVTERNFQAEVLDQSYKTPVVIDFWAPWCGPCRILGPVLERLAAEYNGNLVLAKVNVDENPRLATQYGVQGIPAVKAFRNGRVASEFVGAQPEPVVRDFLRQLIPTEADRQVERAQSLELAGRFAAAEAAYRQALADEPQNSQALLGLGRVLLAQGHYDQATTYLEQVPPLTPEADQAQGLLKSARLQSEAASFEGEPVLRQRLAANPNDLETRYRLAVVLASTGRHEEALENLLEIVRRDRKFRDDGARLAMLAIFDTLGGDNELTRRYQSKLAMLLF